jgi:glycosyltransferase involved in cell wall biosynthesis
MSTMTVAICTYNRADRLPELITAVRSQECPIAFEILVIDNNSNDNTQLVVRKLIGSDGAPLRYVKEVKQGIVCARNRAIEEAHGAYLAFIDDDEIPGPHWLEAAVDALEREEADCVGGEIRVRLAGMKRPSWLDEELMGFLGQVSHSPLPFWITDRSTGVWSGNIAYRMTVFSNGLRFDHRYNREGEGIGGGSDGIMFRTLLASGAKIRYRPDMLIKHHIEEWKIKRTYFLKLHFLDGVKAGRWGTDDNTGTFLGVPLFMVRLLLKQCGKTISILLKGQPGAMRQAMNGSHAVGMIVGKFGRWRTRR